MTQERLNYLRDELRKERISTGELIEIEEEFRKIPDKELPEPRANAMASDMLNELESRIGDK